MNKNKFAHKIATELWGWTHHPMQIQRAGNVPEYWEGSPKYHGNTHNVNIEKEIFSWAGVGRTQEIMVDRGSCLISMHGGNRFGCMDSMCQKDEHSQDWVLWKDEELEYPDEHFWSVHTAALKMVEQLDKEIKNVK